MYLLSAAVKLRLRLFPLLGFFKMQPSNSRENMVFYVQKFEKLNSNEAKIREHSWTISVLKTSEVD